MLIRARIVLPILGPPIADGGLVISGDRVAAVGSWRDLKAGFAGQSVDLGDVILMPGLVNAHCHLDYTRMAGQIPPPKNFPDWIKAMLALKANWSYSEYGQSWLCGAEALLRTGTTTVADIEAVPELLPDAWSGTPLRVYSFLELTGVKSSRTAPEIVNEALQKIETAPHHSVGLSPHALYSTKPELLRLTATECRKRKLRITTHVAESREEFEMYLYRRGPLFDWLKTQRDMSDCDGSSPIQQLARVGLLSPDFLAVHVNHLVDGDAALLARNGASVVHCPQSHAYFNHAPFRYKELVAAGVNVCLGTDSAASLRHSPTQPAQLNLFAEMRAFQSRHPKLPPTKLLEMATINGARALGLAGSVGELSENAFADLIAVPFGGTISEAETAIVHCSGEVSQTMIDGQWLDSTK